MGQAWRVIHRAVVTAVLIALVGSCAPTIYQSPRVLERGEGVIGLGFAAAGYMFFDSSPHFRYGLGHRTDLGIKLFGLRQSGSWTGYNLMVDVKYAIRQNSPLLISGDLGVAVTYLNFIPDNEYKIWSIHPLVLFGRERVYGGIGIDYWQEHRLQIRNMGFEPFVPDKIYNTRIISPRLMLGVSIGRKWRLIPEIHIQLFALEGRTHFIMAIGIQRQF